VNEGGSVAVTAAGSDPEGGPLAYAWDLDNDGFFETPGQSVTFSAAELDGPAGATAAVQATDSGGLTATAQSFIDILNVAPTASFTGAPGKLFAGQSATLAFSSPFDPGAADTTTGFRYAYDCSGDGIFEAAGLSSPSYTCAYPQGGVFAAAGRIADRDGGFTDYTVAVTVLTPQQGILGIIDQVNDLVDEGILKQAEGHALIVKLQSALDQLGHNDGSAINKLEAFIHDVQALIKSRRLAPEIGQPLIDEANAIIAALGG
jgi:hypothetical protein